MKRKLKKYDVINLVTIPDRANNIGECELPLMFDGGFISFDDVKRVRAEKMAANRNRTRKVKEEENVTED